MPGYFRLWHRGSVLAEKLLWLSVGEPCKFLSGLVLNNPNGILDYARRYCTLQH